MEFKQAAALEGQTILVQLHQYRVPMHVLDVKHSYGEYRFKVTPKGGEGIAWVSEARILETERV